MRTYNLAPLNVLLIDDSAYMLKLLGMYLRAMEVGTVRSLDDPSLAVDEIRRTLPDLVITDILMHPVDGVALTAAIRQLRPDPVAFTPIFILSGLTDRRHVTRARDAGAHEVLAKPIPAQALYARICALIERPPNFVEADGYFGPERRTARRARVGPERRHDPGPRPEAPGEDAFEIDVD